MSISDTAKARKYASIAEVAAASAKLNADKLELAPDYAEQAANSASQASESALIAGQAVVSVNALAISASESATSAAASAAEAGDAASAAISRSLRVPSGELISEFPQTSERLNSVHIFNDSGDVSIKPIAQFAIIGDDGKIPVSIIPSIALSQPFVVNSESSMLALDAQVGDIAKRTDLGYSFCLASEPATILGNWVQLTDDVLSILGLSSGATSIGALDDDSNPTTVQGALGLKASQANLTQSIEGVFNNLLSEGDKKVGSSYGGTVYSDYVQSRYKKKGMFSVGGVVTDRTQAMYHSDGFWYINIGGTLPVTVAAGSSPDSAWLCVGLLGFYPTNYALNFGVSTSGDMTAKVRLLHAYCNYFGEEADYTGVTTVTVNSTAVIPLNSDVQWAGVSFNFLFTNTLPDFTFSPVFRAYDPSTPLETVPDTWQSGTLLADRTTLTNTTYNFEEGVICFDTSINYGKRYPTDTVFYKLRQVFKVFKGGLLDHPIDISISGGPLGTVQFRKQPTKTIRLRGAVVDVSNNPQLQFISIERNKVILEDIQIINTTNINNIRNVIWWNKVCDLTLRGIRGPGNEPGPSNLGNGTYNIGGEFGANVLMENLGMDGGMPNIGCNVMNGVEVRSSHINRYDTHAWMHNTNIHHNTFGMYGVTYGIGGGYLRVDKNTFIKGYVPGRGDFVTLSSFTLITARSDYGGVFYGCISAQGNLCLMDTRVDLSAGGATYPYRMNVLAFESSGDYGFTEKKPWAYSIDLMNNICQAPSFSVYFDFAGVFFSDGLSTGSLFPQRINIDGISFRGNPQDNHQIIPVIFPTNYGTVTCQNSASQSGGNCSILYRNVRSAIMRGRNADRSSLGWLPSVASQTDTNRVVPYVQISDCTGISVRWSIVGSTVLVTNSEVRDFSTASSGVPSNNINFTGCMFYFVDGSQSQVSNCRIYSSRILRQSAATGNVQFGGVLSAQGVTLGSGVTLANGGFTAITVDSIFTGYK